LARRGPLRSARHRRREVHPFDQPQLVEAKVLADGLPDEPTMSPAELTDLSTGADAVP